MNNRLFFSGRKEVLHGKMVFIMGWGGMQLNFGVGVKKVKGKMNRKRGDDREPGGESVAQKNKAVKSGFIW